MTDPERPETTPPEPAEDHSPPLLGASREPVEDDASTEAMDLMWYGVDVVTATFMAATIVWLSAPESDDSGTWFFCTFVPSLLMSNGVRDTIKDANALRFQQSSLLRVSSGAWLLAWVLFIGWLAEEPLRLYIWPLLALPFAAGTTIAVAAVHFFFSRALSTEAARQTASAAAEKARRDTASDPTESGLSSKEPGSGMPQGRGSDGNSPFWMLGILLLLIIAGAISARYRADMAFNSVPEDNLRTIPSTSTPGDARHADADSVEEHIHRQQELGRSE
nr:hypothetical protein [Stenotrophomonas rhizophila]